MIGERQKKFGANCPDKKRTLLSCKKTPKKQTGTVPEKVKGQVKGSP